MLLSATYTGHILKFYIRYHFTIAKDIELIYVFERDFPFLAVLKYSCDLVYLFKLHFAILKVNNLSIPAQCFCTLDYSCVFSSLIKRKF